MSSVFNSKRALVMGVVVFILLLMKINSFADEEWEVITQLPTERITFATAVVGHKIYLIGGSVLNGGLRVTSTVEAYDTQTRTWQKVADMPIPRHDAKAVVVNGTIFVFGGWNGPRDQALRKYPVNVEAYNPRTDTWVPKQDMPVSRIEFDVGVVAGKIYIIGGAMRSGGERIDRVDVYNSATDTWVKGQEMPTPREGLGVGVVGNRIYAIGGRGWPRVGFGPHLTVVEEYNPTSRQWQKKGDMLDMRGFFALVTVRDSIYLIGGAIFEGADAEHLGSVNVYAPQKDAWDEIPALPISLLPQGAAVVDGRIYVFGGTVKVGKGEELFSDVLVYDTGFRAVEANGKLFTRWGVLKGEQQRDPERD